MKIGVISDSHDNIQAVKKAVDFLKARKVNALIHCGDFCAPFVMDELAGFGGEIHCVFGNIDDRYNTPLRAKNLDIVFHGDLADFELGGRKILVNHYPKIAEAFAHTGRYDAVFFGHSHISEKKTIGKTLLLNPGELAGKLGKKTAAIYDTDTNEAEILTI